MNNSGDKFKDEGLNIGPLTLLLNPEGELAILEFGGHRLVLPYELISKRGDALITSFLNSSGVSVAAIARALGCAENLSVENVAWRVRRTIAAKLEKLNGSDDVASSPEIAVEIGSFKMSVDGSLVFIATLDGSLTASYTVDQLTRVQTVQAIAKELNQPASLVRQKIAELLKKLREHKTRQAAGVTYAPCYVDVEKNIIAELCRDGAEVFFYVYRDGDIKKMDQLTIDSKVLKPLSEKELNKIVEVPSHPENYDDEEGLFNEVRAFLSKYHVSKYRWEKDIDTLYVFLTWVFDALPIIPYRKMTGPKGSGKSHWLKVIGSICYRPVKAAGASSEASLKRLIDRWRGTILVDESDFSNSSLYATIVKILNIGFDRDLGWLTVCEKDEPASIETFYVFGPKIVTTREHFRDDALESRFITTSPVKSEVRFLGPTFENTAAELRNKLLMWRFRNFWKATKIINALEDSSIQRAIFNDSRLEPRTLQILLPLYFLTSSEEVRRIIKELAGILSELSLSDEEAILRDVIRTLTHSSTISPEGRESHLGEEFVSYKLGEICEAINPDLDPTERKSFNRRVAKVLRSAGAIVERGARGIRVVKVPLSLINIFEGEGGSKYPSCVTSVTSGTHINFAHPMGQTVSENINTNEREDRKLYMGDSGDSGDANPPRKGGDPVNIYIFHSFVLPTLIANYKRREKRGRFSGLPEWSRKWIKEIVETPGDGWLSYITCRCDFRVLTVGDFLSHLRGWHGIKEEVLES